LDPDLFRHLNFRIGISQQMLQQITLGGAMIVLPLFLQMTLEYNAMEAGLSLAPLSLSMFGMAMLAGRKGGRWRPAQIVLCGFALTAVGMAVIIPLVPRVDSGWYLVIPLIVAGSGLGMLVSQLNEFTLAPISEERVSEAAGVNSAAGSFGLSFGLAVAGGVMLWALALSFTHQTEASAVIPPAQQQQISTEIEHDAEVMSNSQLQHQIVDEPKAVQAEVLAINNHARNLSLQIALLIPALASLLGLANSFRMLRLPDIVPAADIDGVGLG
jgi:Na+/melibiose symporter-like transporter